MNLTRPKEKLHPSAFKVWSINGCIESFLILIFLIAYWLTSRFFGPWPVWGYYGLLGMLLLTAFTRIAFVPAVRMRYWGYEIHEDFIDIQSGIFIIKRTLIPVARIQHIDTEHGPIMRIFHLATIAIATAGTQHRIPALHQDTAEELRKKIAALAKVSEDDV